MIVVVCIRNLQLEFYVKKLRKKNLFE